MNHNNNLIGDIAFKLMQNFKEEFIREFVNLF